MVKTEVFDSDDDDDVFAMDSDIDENPVAAKQLKDIIDVEQIAIAIIPKATELTTRTVQRMSDENQILDDLVSLLDNFNENLEVIPFGSATYGFSGSHTNFNICLIDNGNANVHATN